MGMFDHLTCKYPLPVSGANDLDYQTKDTPSQVLDNYEIREDGALWFRDYTVRVEDDPKSPVGITVHRENEVWKPVILTGEIRFYTTLQSDHTGWIEWSGYFERGILVRLNLIEHRQPEDSVR